MKRRTLIAASGRTLVGLSLPGGVKAQAGPHRIGLLTGFNRAAVDAFLGDLRPELEKLGSIEGRDYVMLKPRTSEGANDRLPALADELVSQAPHLILVSSIPATRALAKATKTVPVVMAGWARRSSWDRRRLQKARRQHYRLELPRRRAHSQVAPVPEGSGSSPAERRGLHQPEQRSCHRADQADARRRDGFGDAGQNRGGRGKERLRISVRGHSQRQHGIDTSSRNH